MNSYIKSSIEQNLSINYIEIIFKEKNSNENNINWTKENFDKLIVDLVNKNYNCFRKKYDVYRYQNLDYILNEDSQEKIMVYSSNLIDCLHDKDSSVIYHGIIKNNIPIYLFPSTKNIHDKSTVTRISFKINNRIYINFEIQRKNELTYYKVYINYNHNSKVDLISNLSKLSEYLIIMNKLVHNLR